MNAAREWIDALGLERHPEGGWYREIYRSAETIPQRCLPARFDGDRAVSTAIYFLLEESEYSALHRLRQDELWHFYDGAAITLHTIDPSGEYSAVRLGRNRDQGEELLRVVPAGWLFGVTVDDTASFALAGCTVSPGFDFADFDMPGRDELLEEYPQHRQLIERLTRE